MVLFLTLALAQGRSAKVLFIFCNKAEDGKLTWNAVTDPNHCYYRIFADGKQIASTVACDLPIENEAAAYTVLSVDQWGNV